MSLQILMPMAGLGSRFQFGDKAVLKPLISIGGKAMYQRVLTPFLNEQWDFKLHFVIKQIDQDVFFFGTKLQAAFPDSTITVLPHMTRGALETCLQGSFNLISDESLLVLDCDFEFYSTDFFSYLKKCHSNKEAGALVSFHSQDPRYSYARIENERVVETAEKKVISSNALAGAYFFCKARYLIEEGNAVLNECSQDLNEKNFYIAPIFNRLIRKDKEVRLFSMDHYTSFGTPEELQKSLHRV